MVMGSHSQSGPSQWSVAATQFSLETAQREVLPPAPGLPRHGAASVQSPKPKFEWGTQGSVSSLKFLFCFLLGGILTLGRGECWGLEGAGSSVVTPSGLTERPFQERFLVIPA